VAKNRNVGGPWTGQRHGAQQGGQLPVAVPQQTMSALWEVQRDHRRVAIRSGRDATLVKLYR